MSLRLSRRQMVVLGLSLIPASLLSACSSRSSSLQAPSTPNPAGAGGAAQTSVAASPSTATQPSAGSAGFKGATISAQMAPELHSTPALLAHDLGFFKDQGLEVNMEVTHAQIDTMTALLAGGKLDWFTANTDASLHNAIVRGAPIKVTAVGEIGKKGWHYTAMLFSDQLWKRGVQKIEDLKPQSQIDLTAGMKNTPGRKLYRYLKFHGFNDPYAQFQVKEWLNPAPVVQSFAAGQIDAVFSGQPRAAQLEKQGGHILGWDTDAPETEGEPGTLLALNENWLKPDPERGVRLAMGYLKGIQVYLDLVQSGWKDPKLRKLVADRTQTPERLFDGLGGPYIPANGQTDLAKIDQAIGFFRTTMPVITGDLLPAKQYVDFSYAKEAATRLRIKD